MQWIGPIIRRLLVTVDGLQSSLYAQNCLDSYCRRQVRLRAPELHHKARGSSARGLTLYVALMPSKKSPEEKTK